MARVQTGQGGGSGARGDNELGLEELADAQDEVADQFNVEQG